MNSTDALREFVEKWGNGTFNIRKQNECLSDLTALISEHYTEKAKYDELLQQRDELKEALKQE